MSVYLLSFFFVAIAWADFDFPPLIIIFMCLILDLSMMSLAYDKVVPSALPNKWNLAKIIGIAIVLALVAAFGSLLFLSFLRNNSFGMGVWNRGMVVDCGYPYAYDSAGVKILPARGLAIIAKSVKCGDLDPYQGGCEGTTYSFTGAAYSDDDSLDDQYSDTWGDAPQVVYPLPASRAQYQCDTHNRDPECGGVNFATYVGANKALAGLYYYIPGDKTIPHVGYPNGYMGKNDDYTSSMLGYSTESGATALFDPRNFPYSSAVENSVMFLQLSLCSLFTVLSARVDGWFFIRRPGYVLLGIISSVMVIITITVGVMRPYPFWFPNTDHNTIRLTAVDGKYIGVAWLYTIVLFLCMECAKWVVYKAIELNRTNELAATKRMKLKEELRRRMTRRTAGYRTSIGSGSVNGGGSGLAPRSTSVVRASVSTSKQAQYDGANLNEPLLSDDYAA